MSNRFPLRASTGFGLTVICLLAGCQKPAAIVPTPVTHGHHPIRRPRIPQRHGRNRIVLGTRLSRWS